MVLFMFHPPLRPARDLLGRLVFLGSGLKAIHGAWAGESAVGRNRRDGPTEVGGR